jgi:peptidoglycan hydrolase-like protein with peptidoglycan-binding domain
MGGTRFLALLGATVAVLLALPVAHASAGDAKVAALQVAMTGEGLYPHPVDGVMGPWTQQAVRSFQAAHGLPADGVAGPQTRAALGKRGGPRLGARPMHEGQRGWDVAALQFLLHSRGFEPRGFDGGFGPNTDEAVRRYQAAGHLDVDGVAGQSTLNALRGGQVITATPSDPVRFLRPVPGAVTDGFGWVGGRWHTGLDFPEPKGTPIHAAGVGVVSFAGANTGGYGNLVVISHRLGFESWYAHMSAVAATAGQSVTGGTTIGYVGSTGFSTGPHLHFEVRQYGTPIDPTPRLLGIVAAARAHRATRARGASDHRWRCRPNADARSAKNVQPATARLDRCP